MTDLESVRSLLRTEKLGLERITDLEETVGLDPGQNYSSIIRRFRVTGLDHTGSQIVSSLLLKQEKAHSPELNIDFQIFQAEIRMYTEMLPAMERLSEETGGPLLWPLCRGVRNYDLIILEDLKESGYSMRDRRVPMPAETAVFVAGELGRFHGLSLAVIERGLFDPHSLPVYIYTRDHTFIHNLLAGGFLTLADSIQATWQPQWLSVADSLREVAANVGDRLRQLSGRVGHEFRVICHGDCWTNNILFKKGSTSPLPSSLKFVDFQACHYGSFAWDLTYLMHTSMAAAERKGCHDKMMGSYRTSLVETMEKLGLDTTVVPSIASMNSVMDDFKLFGMIAAFSLFPVTINTMEKPWEVGKNMEEFGNTHNPVLFENPLFIQSALIDIPSFKEAGLL